MGAPVLGTPPDALLASPWRALQRGVLSAAAAADALFDPVAYVDDDDSDTQARPAAPHFVFASRPPWGPAAPLDAQRAVQLAAAHDA